MKKIVIKPADSNSIDFVVDYILKCNFKKYSNLQFKKIKEQYLKRLKSEAYKCYLASLDENLVGYVDLDMRRSDCLNTIWINEIYVLKNYRCAKIGTKLIKHAEKMAKDLGFDAIYMNTEPDNRACLNLVEKKGYKHVQYILKKKI